MKELVALLTLASFVSCGGSKTSTGAGSEGSTTPAKPAYESRIGMGVSTGARRCLAIHNANIASGTPVTLVQPTLPQTFTPAEIGAASETACPISKDVDTTVTNYELHVDNKDALQKLVPLIGVVAAPARFHTGTSNDVRSDFDADGKSESFRECSSTDGVHLTVWVGNPLDGTLIWHGFYYQPENTAPAPPCTPREAVAP